MSQNKIQQLKKADTRSDESGTQHKSISIRSKVNKSPNKEKKDT